MRDHLVRAQKAQDSEESENRPQITQISENGFG